VAGRAEITACFIVRGDPLLERAVASIRPHVTEVAIACTSPEPEDQERARALADRFTVCLEANDEEGQIIDFSVARSASFRIATSAACLWLDSDDEIVGGEHLAELLAMSPEGRPSVWAMPYEYEHDEKGRCVALVQRERLVCPRHAFEWQEPVHEGLVPLDPNVAVGRVDPGRPDSIVVVHRRPGSRAAATARNLRILKRDVERRPEHARSRFYLAMAHFDAGDHDAAAHTFPEALEFELHPDERTIACLRMASVQHDAGDLDGALEWAMLALKTRQWGEVYFTIARIEAAMAKEGGTGALTHWASSAHYARVGLSTPATSTAMWINPHDRAFHAPSALSEALGKIGDFEGALAACETALAAAPGDRAATGNRLLYRAGLAAKTAAKAAETLGEVRSDVTNLLARGVIGRDTADTVRSVIGRESGESVLGLDIAFACGVAVEPWDPRLIEKRGMGGSETAVVEVAKRLAAKGHRVRVYCNCGAEGLYDGVRYLAAERLPRAEPADVLVAWRNADGLEIMRGRVRWLWVHDVGVGGSTDPWRMHRTDRVLGLSSWHVRALAAQGIPTEKIHQTRNGIDHARFKGPPVPRVATRAVFSSAPTRGLEELCNLWPTVRMAVPEATLDCYYGFDSWEASCRANDDGEGLERIARLRALVEATDGVTMRGRVSPRDLAKAMSGAGVWVHPAWDNGAGGKFYETSCLGLVEAQAAGCRVVAAAHGAIPEAAFKASLVDYGDASLPSREDWSEFASAIVEAMQAPEEDGGREAIADAVSHLSWDSVAEQWEAWMASDIEAKNADDRAMVESIKASRPQKLKLQIILSPDGSGRQLLDPTDPSGGRAGGGGKAGFLGLTRAMGRLGTYDVTALSTFKDRFHVIDGVTYLGLDELAPPADVVIAYYDVRVLSQVMGPLRVGMHHTLAPYNAWPFIDVNTAPSEYALEYCRRLRPRATWRVVPNAVEGLEGVVWKPVPGRVLHHTSPDRGLYNLLERWGEIRARVPHATLHVAGNPGDMAKAYQQPSLKGSIEYDMAIRLEAGMATAKEIGGVRFLGSLPRVDLLEEIASAACFASAFEMLIPSETWSITIHECCEVGVPCVIAPADALRSLWEDVVECGPDIADDRGEFVDSVVRMLTDEKAAREVSTRQKAHVAQFSFDRTAQAMDSAIREALDARKGRAA
jgi:glycosyltransferase involved in cell wall biosynthesis/tetratricopeptide (TPR) repeat protein